MYWKVWWMPSKWPFEISVYCFGETGKWAQTYTLTQAGTQTPTLVIVRRWTCIHQLLTICWWIGYNFPFERILQRLSKPTTLCRQVVRRCFPPSILNTSFCAMKSCSLLVCIGCFCCFYASVWFCLYLLYPEQGIEFAMEFLIHKRHCRIFYKIYIQLPVYMWTSVSVFKISRSCSFIGTADIGLL